MFPVLVFQISEVVGDNVVTAEVVRTLEKTPEFSKTGPMVLCLVQADGTHIEYPLLSGIYFKIKKGDNGHG